MPLSKAFYMFTTFFCLRRIAVAFTTIFAKQLIVQIYVNVFASLLMLGFFINMRPMEERLQNRIETANEVFTLFSNYFMIMFTDFIPDLEYRYSLGFKAIAIILIVVGLNILLVFYDLGSGVILEAKKMRARR